MVVWFDLIYVGGVVGVGYWKYFDGVGVEDELGVEDVY